MFHLISYSRKKVSQKKTIELVHAVAKYVYYPTYTAPQPYTRPTIRPHYGRLCFLMICVGDNDNKVCGNQAKKLPT
jgi:hypothetical protein